MVETRRYRTILLFGMPGSGKGTQGAVLGQLPGLLHVSTGDVFRKLPRQSSLHQEVVGYTSRGVLVPDELTVRIWDRYVKVLELQEEIDPGRTTLVLDGIPRNLGQAQRLADRLDVVLVLHLRIRDFQEARERLAVRALRENRLDDINDEVIRRRLEVYEEETLKTLDFYESERIVDVDASQSPLKVHRDIVEAMVAVEERQLAAGEAPSVTAEGI